MSRENCTKQTLHMELVSWLDYRSSMFCVDGIHFHPKKKTANTWANLTKKGPPVSTPHRRAAQLPVRRPLRRHSPVTRPTWVTGESDYFF